MDAAHTVVFSNACWISSGVVVRTCAGGGGNIKATHPAAYGLAMLVLFMSMNFCKYQWEMVVMAPPGGAVILILQSLSAVGPTNKGQIHVEWVLLIIWELGQSVFLTTITVPLIIWSAFLLLHA